MPIERDLYTAEQVRRIDRAAIDGLGIAGFELMRRAAAAAFAALRRRWPSARRLVVLAGAGNNGGDAFLLGALALREGFAVEALALTATSTGDASAAREAFVAAGGAVALTGQGAALPGADVYIDGLFGSGLSRDIDGVARELIEALNARRANVLALDVPSGLDADRGVPRGVAVRADVTVCFVGWKSGLFTADGADCCGQRELATLDIPSSAFDGVDAQAQLLGDEVFDALPPRRANSNKGTYGHVLVVGGDHGFGGAVRLCAAAALRSGAGLVSVATRTSHVAAFNAALPEAMARGIETNADLDALLTRANVLALGPGLGQGEWSQALFDAALATGKPCVVDADALNLLALSPRPLGASSVITPHPGEAARLLGCDVATIQSDRFRTVRELARRYDTVAVLKGSGSLVAVPDGRVAVCRFGNPGMASGGMGDVLTGVVAALLAQGLSAWDAACFGVAAHARAGDLTAAEGGQRGLLASDLLPALRRVLNGIDR